MTIRILEQRSAPLKVKETSCNRCTSRLEVPQTDCVVAITGTGAYWKYTCPVCNFRGNIISNWNKEVA